MCVWPRQKHLQNQVFIPQIPYPTWNLRAPNSLTRKLGFQKEKKKFKPCLSNYEPSTWEKTIKQHDQWHPCRITKTPNWKLPIIKLNQMPSQNVRRDKILRAKGKHWKKEVKKPPLVFTIKIGLREFITTIHEFNDAIIQCIIEVKEGPMKDQDLLYGGSSKQKLSRPSFSDMIRREIHPRRTRYDAVHYELVLLDCVF